MADFMNQKKALATSDPLAVEKAYLASNLEELTNQFPEKYLLIKGQEAFGSFETYEQGVEAGFRAFGRGPFLVRSAVAPQDAEAPSIPALAVGVPLVTNP